MTLDELHFVARRLKELTEHAMTDGRDLGLAPAEGAVMADLLRNGCSAINDIRRRTGFAQSRVSSAVAVLHKRGWLRVDLDDADRRRTVVEVSEEIRRRAERATGKSARPMLESLLSDLDAGDRAQVIEALETLHGELAESA